MMPTAIGTNNVESGNVNELKSLLQKLNINQLEDVSSYIFSLMNDIEMDNHLEEAHLNNGIICPNCQSNQCVKNGSVRGKQRFLCRDCLKTFGVNSKSAISNTKLSSKQWHEYIKCLINGYSIRKSADIVDVCVKTSFYMRHKILDAIKLHLGRGNVSGIVEMDETFLAESFKGNHKKSGFNMGRKPHKRGKQIHLRGLSSKQICIGTAIDKNDNLIMEMACKGRISLNKLERLYDGYIEEESTICTDSLRSYKTLSKKLNLKHKQIASGKFSNGSYNLSCINSLHSRFKGWIRKFNGVSTKFLPNYLSWFKWLENNKNIKDSAKPEQMWNNAMAKQVDVRIEVLRERGEEFV